MTQLIDLIVADDLDVDELLHVLHVRLAAREARHARAGQRDLAGGGKLKHHVGVAVLLAQTQDIGEGHELALELMDAVGIVPHEQEVGSRRLQPGDALDGLVGVDDAVGIGILRHVPHTLDRRVLDELLDQIHIRAGLGHGNGDELEAEALRDLEVAVIARRGAEPLDMLLAAPRFFAVQQTVGVRLGDGVVHELQAGVTADEHLLRLAAEDLGKERLGARQAGELAVVAHIHVAVHAVRRIGHHRENIGHQIELLLARTPARHVELQALGLPRFKFSGHLFKFGLALFSRHFPVFHRNGPPISNVGEIIAYPFPKHNVQKKKRAKPSFSFFCSLSRRAP